MAFPTSPTNGQTATVNGVVYTYNSTLTAWTVGTEPGGNISGNVLNITSNASIGTTLIVTGNITGGNVAVSGVSTAASYSATGNITGGNIVTGGVLQAPVVKLAAASGGSIGLVPTNTASAFTVTVPAVSGTMALQNGVGVGKVLQVIHTAKSSSFVGTSVVDNGGYFIDVTGLSATITPTSASSKILIFATLFIGPSTVASGYQQSYRLKRTIGGVVSFPILGDAEGGRPGGTGRINLYIPTQYAMNMNGGTHQDTPNTTSAITYQVQLGGYSGSPIVYLNRSETWQVSAGNYDVVPVSTLTLMEIAA
jgi:hypothetical protein